MTLSKHIAQGSGKEPCELVLRGGQIFDVITGTMIAGDIAICGKTIVGIADEYDANDIVDIHGKTVVPGFIDTHLHIESSLVTPFEFDRCVAPLGVTTAICDPHEIANVIGLDGIKYFLDAAQHCLMDIRVQLSSCVPSTHMETAGATILAHDLEPFMDHPQSSGLAEFMNFPGVLAQLPEVMDKLSLFQGRHIDGHAPQLSGKALNGYISAGIRTEHEATTVEEAREKLQKGMRILIREGSVSKDLHALLPLLTDITSPYMCLCTDDRNPLDIAEQGHLDYMIRTAISHGVPPLAVYRAASLSAAEAFGLKDRGLIAPGKRADIVVLNDLDTCDIHSVYAAGRLVNDHNFAQRRITDPVGFNSVKAPHLSLDSFKTPSNQTQTDVIGIIEGKIITKHLRYDIAPRNGDKGADVTRDLIKISVIERHGKNGNIATGFVRGFGLQHGAIATTVCHDHHNIAVVGIDHNDMLVAAERLSQIQGGFVVVKSGCVIAELPLPIAGLMSDQPFEHVRERLVDLRKAAKDLGVTLDEPFLQLAFLALPVIPALKITDHGMIDVNTFEVISPALHR